ncbi:MAG TPA: exopolysaccharide biosynthesis polyprenyl glycosylphosphotransferase [Bryobacterales bacterium]|nr:exopolysaccharide biosynthesis polyprenyl glycosylphosphotransferase [Bryobacterales bacterium]
MFGRHKKKVKFLFALADVILTVATFEAAYEVRVYLPLEHAFFIVGPIRALMLGAALAAWVGIGLALRVYERLDTGEPRTVLNDSLKQVAGGILALVGFLYLMKLDISRAFIALFGVFNLLALIAYRVSARSLRGYLRRRFGAVSHFLIVGTGATAQQVGRALEQAEEYGVKLLAFVEADSGPAGAAITLENGYAVHTLGELPGMLRNQVIDEIIFAVDRERLADLENIFLLCDEQGVRTRVVVNFFPHVNSEVYLDQLGSFSLLTFSATPHDEIRLLVKRAFDFTLALLALALAAAPLALFAALVRLTSRGPAIFKQVRCGLNGRRFTFYKLRSMCHDAEEKKAELEALNERDGPAFKMSKDPRLTLLGRYLRRFSIDEWPQLWNVLKGDMSFVGPRPAVPAEVERYQGWQRRRLRMKPGLTCLWVLEGRDHLDFETWMRLDMQYIDNWSLLLDLKILLRSFPRVLLGRGAS